MRHSQLTSEDSESDDPEANKTHLLAGSYYSMKGGLSATLMLNNKGPFPLEVQPTLFSLAGASLDIAPVTVEPNSFRMINLSEWAAPGGEAFQEGSVQLFHRGRDLVLGAQIYLLDAEHSLSFDEKLAEIGNFGSTRLEGIWWMPSDRSEVKLVLSNTSDDPLSVTARLAGVKHCQSDPQTVNFLPRETHILDVRQNFSGGDDCAKSEIEAISLEHAGSKSALLARAMVQDAQKGYSFPVQFSNPQGGKSQQYHGAGLRVGRVAGEPLTPIVVARNVGETTTILSGRMPYSTSTGAMGVVSLPDIELHAGEMKLLDLQRAIRKGATEPNIATAGLEFEYTTAPGSVLISAQSVSNSGNQVFRVPMWDPLAQRSPTGGYPWYIEGDSSTTVYIKNITDHPQHYIAHVLFSGGMYTAGVQTVQGHQTTAFNLRELRDNKVPDEDGRTIPVDVSRGQILWSMDQNVAPEVTSEFENLALIGRSEQVDTTKAISSNYACQNCCINDFRGAYIEPSSTIGDVGGQQQFVAKIVKATCYTTPLPSTLTSTTSARWSSDNPSVVTIDSSGLATALAGGTATIEAEISARTSVTEPCEPGPMFASPSLDATAISDGVDPEPDFAPCGSCRPVYFTYTAAATATVRPTVSKIQYQSGTSFVDITGTLYVLSGTAVTLKAIPNPTNAAWPAGRPTWSGSSGAAGAGPTTTVTFNTVSSSTSDYKTVTASSGNAVTVNVIVYNLNGILTAEDNFSGRSTTRFGLEERITLSYGVTPAVTLTQIGGLQWKVLSGGGTMAATTSGTVTYTAPESPDAVILKLEVQTGPSKGGGPTESIIIVAPSDAYMTKIAGTNLKHVHDSWSVGFLGNIYLLPKDVSFRNLQFFEGATLGVGSGWLSDFGGTPHPQSAVSRPITSGNILTGCRVVAEDNAYSGAKFPTLTSPYANGVWYWDIPWFYVTSSNAAVRFMTARQNHTSDASGKAIITKGGASFQRIPSDPESSY
jgi:hypothetical protein